MTIKQHYINKKNETRRFNKNKTIYAYMNSIKTGNNGKIRCIRNAYTVKVTIYAFNG